ncbi:DUF2857 domain-containing protein [Kosakonia sp. MUSA4]|uniref:DUF2857 domain-containing protein n=1 Tax=Kosakonia sp. MUSA4 TaxID=2067958 RepID=UPI0015976939|nr:DUF2857 domain-containing protein [Kosakonia sp. MUSA4]QJT79316.1 hypothetical protein C0557_04175 [Kosakonia sp. MUSA4]
MTPSVNQAVLTHVMQALKEGQIRYCESLGFSPQELFELTRLTVDDMLYLSNSAVQFITLSIDHNMLSRMLTRTEQERVFQQNLEEALSLGASIEFITHFFGLSTLEVCARRRLIGLFVRQGRNNAPDEAVEALVWNEWQKTGVMKLDSPDALKAMMTIARSHKLSLTVIWNLLRQWHQEKLLHEE